MSIPSSAVTLALHTQGDAGTRIVSTAWHHNKPTASQMATLSLTSTGNTSSSTSLTQAVLGPVTDAVGQSTHNVPRTPWTELPVPTYQDQGAENQVLNLSAQIPPLMSLGYQSSIPKMPITTVVTAMTSSSVLVVTTAQHQYTPTQRPSVRGYTSVPPIYGAERLPQIPLTTVAWVTAPSYGAGTSANAAGMPMAYASANSHATQRDRNKNVAYLGAYLNALQKQRIETELYL